MERLQKSGRAVMCFIIHKNKQHYLVHLIAVHQSPRNGDHHPLFSCWSCTRSRSVDWRSWLMPTYMYNICNLKGLLQIGFSVVLWSQYGPINVLHQEKKKKRLSELERRSCVQKSSVSTKDTELKAVQQQPPVWYSVQYRYIYHKKYLQNSGNI